MHISSLPGPYYCGDLGKAAYRFADFLSDSGQSWWQMLPVNPVGLGNSPYSTICSFAGEPLYIELEGLAPPRPLPHDLFKNFADAYGIHIMEVNIHKLEDGVFFANILCDNGGERTTLDARTSDAIALALRFKCPIYTTEAIVEKAGLRAEAVAES